MKAVPFAVATGIDGSPPHISGSIIIKLIENSHRFRDSITKATHLRRSPGGPGDRR
jgi:hypothetical protein